MIKNDLLKTNFVANYTSQKNFIKIFKTSKFRFSNFVNFYDPYKSNMSWHDYNDPSTNSFTYDNKFKTA